MKILNFGSLNIDHVYQVSHFVQPGETLSASEYQRNAGGKGLNQSIALARAGVEVYHAGQIGVDGEFLKELLENNRVHVNFLKISEAPTGHAMIQVNEEGQNCILICGGANQTIDEEHMKSVFSAFKPDDFALFQNEINGLPKLISLASDAGMKIILNPSPIGPELSECDLSKIDYFIMNEIEGEAISGKKDPIEIMDEMHRRYPKAKVVLTLGGDGACYGDGNEYHYQEAIKVTPVDTTAAGDTFTGYFFASIMNGIEPGEALKIATKAASIAVSRAGAACSIPMKNEL